MNTPIAIQTDIPDLSAVTERYRFISSKQFIADVEAQGFALSKVQTAKRGKGMGKHIMTFTHNALPKVDKATIQLIAINAHNGTSSFQFHAGLNVWACLNGLVFGASIQSARIVHIRYALDKVKEATEAMLSRMQAATSIVARLQSEQPSDLQIFEFVHNAAKLRSGALPARTYDLLVVRRQEDLGGDAWRVFNRVQEALMRGGYATQGSPLKAGSRARALTGIAATIDLNKKLFDLAVLTLLKEAK